MGVAVKILAVCAGVPHPTEGASTVLFHHYLAALTKVGRVLNVIMVGTDTDQGQIDAHCRRMAEMGAEVRVIRSVRMIRTFLFSHRFDPTLATQVSACGTELRPDVVVEFDLAASMAARGVTAPVRVSWLGDLHFMTAWYHALYSWREGTGRIWHVPSAWFQAQGWKRLYARLLRRHDLVVVSSKSSEANLARLGVRSRYLPYPWPATPRQVGEPPAGPPTFVFFGTLQALGSRSALHAIIDEIHPRLVALWGTGGFRILICGRGQLYPWAEQAFRAMPEIEVRGFVPDVDEVMAISHALIVPIDVPVGNRSRILTALARRLPVVAHTNTALGNPDLVDGETCLMADDADGLVQRMRMVVEQPNVTSMIAERGFALYCRRFAVEPAAGALADEVIRLAGTHTQPLTQPG